MKLKSYLDKFLYLFILVIFLSLVIFTFTKNNSAKTEIKQILPVNKSAKVAIIAPGSKYYRTDLSKNHNQVNSVKRLLKALGFTPLDYTSFGGHPYYADSAEKRAKKFAEAANNADILWSLGGGDGAAQIIEHLNFEELPKDKILIGFSDITSLLLYFEQYQPQLNWNLIHGEVLKRMLNKEHYFKAFELRNFLTRNNNYNHKLELLNTNISPEQIKGRMLGGNIPRIARTMGTTSEIKANDHYGSNKLLMLEDVGEETRKVIGYLEQLEHSQENILGNVDAVIFGQFTDVDKANDDVNWPVDAAIKHKVRNELQHKFPGVAFFKANFFGHGADSNASKHKKALNINTPWGQNFSAIIKLENGKYKLYYSNNKEKPQR